MIRIDLKYGVHVERIEDMASMPLGVQGKDFGEHYKNNTEALRKINDWKWLKEKFNEG